MKAQDVYAGSNGEVTTTYYRLLSAKGPVGLVAVALFRAQKCSHRAKQYRGGSKENGQYKSYRQMAYDRKNWSMGELCKALTTHKDIGIAWGWKEDPAAPRFSWVLYIDLPTGQVSFHSETRMDGPDYKGDWDGVREASAGRVLRWCDMVFGGEVCKSATSE